MNSTPPDFDPNSNPNGFTGDPGNLEKPSLPDQEPIVLNPQQQERLEDAQQKLQRIFLLLVGLGALLGLVVAIALVLVLNRFGLVGAPEESNQSQRILQQTSASKTLLF
jgi:hypothetical protein